MVGGSDARLELRPEVFRHLGSPVADTMGEAALARRSREAGLDRLDDARRTVRDHQQRIAEAAPAHVLEEGAHRLSILLGARAYDDSLIIANKVPEMAYFSGLNGERAVRIWTMCVRSLKDIGFIDI